MICGIINGGREVEVEIRAMVEALSHRLVLLPGSQGSNCPSFTTDRVAHGRAWNVNGILLQFDGEIYNRRELSRELGLWLSPEKDCEAQIIALGYRRWGEDLFRRINGPFALALHDPFRGRLIFCRDRLGLRPLFIRVKAGRCHAFASEIKALLRLDPGNPPEPDYAAFPEYLAFGHIAGERTLYKGIQEVEPGTLIEVKTLDGTVTRKAQSGPIGGRGDEAVEPQEAILRIGDRLKEALERLHYYDPGPLHCFLSGGIDSSILVALLEPIAVRESLPLSTYSVTLPGHKWDEEPYAREVNRRFRCRGRYLAFGPAALAEWWERAILTFDGPLTSTNTVSWLLACRLASRRGAKAVFSGEGADGPFSGALYQEELSRLAAERDEQKRLTGLIFCRTHTLNDPMLVERILEPPLDVSNREAILRDISRGGPGLSLERLEIEYHLKICGNRLLSRAEMMAASQGIRLRLPYLEKGFLDMLLALPYAIKNHLGIKKYPLKGLGLKYFDEAFCFRRKVGFPFPIRGWLRDGAEERLSDYVEMLSDEKSRQRGFYRWSALQEEIKRRKQKAFRPMDWLLWSLVNLELWLRSFPCMLRPPSGALPAVRGTSLSAC